MTDKIGIELPPAGAAVLDAELLPPGKTGGRTVIVSAGISDGSNDEPIGIKGTDLTFGFDGAGTVKEPEGLLPPVILASILLDLCKDLIAASYCGPPHWKSSNTATL